ncbi:MAG: IS1380 family transposase [Kiritimatiellae bacterium]|nr:IS1380 family transposase [Kiritimatiellia bacterium]
MVTECNAKQMEFQGVDRRSVVASFDGGHLSSDGGALLLGELDRRLGVTAALSHCFSDHRDPDLIEHSVVELTRQRVFGLALGYEDLNDHNDLLREPLLALVLGKTDPLGQTRRRASDQGKALASSSTLNRFELTPADANASHRYKKIVYHPQRIQALLVDLFLDSLGHAPDEIILDFDATDDPVHGNQEGKFFHGYYRCYCYLPLYVTCGDHVLWAQLRTSDRDASDGSTEALEYLVERIHARWPETRIIVRADSGFTRDGFMNWCESKGVYYVMGLAKNKRLLQKLGKELAQAHARYLQTGAAARCFTQFQWTTLNSWTRPRRVIGKAEYLAKGPNPRFIVTNLPEEYATPDHLYEAVYCARGDMENRIKEQQLDLFADRTSTSTLRANQLRLWLSTFAYVLMSALRRHALKATRMAKATCGTIRLKLFKIGAQLTISARRFLIRLPSACPYQDVFRAAWQALQHYPQRT